MRLIIATPLYPPESGGPATYAKLLEDGLPSQGIEPIVVKFSDVRKWPKLFRHFLYGRAVRKALKDADAVLALDPVSVGFPALQAAKKLQKPFFVKVVGDYAWEQGTQRFGVAMTLDEFARTPTEKLPLPVQMLRKIETYVARNATKVIVPSVYLKDIVGAWGIHEERIEVVYNGIQLPNGIVPSAKEGSFTIVSSGRRVPWKGFEAIERVAQKHAADGWKAFILSDMPHREALSRVKAADVYVLNSSYEGLSHALIETMMLGTPVIATDAGGNRELIEHGVTGLLIEAGNEASLEKALEEVRADSVGARTRAKAAQMKAFEIFSVSRMLEATAAFVKRHV